MADLDELLAADAVKSARVQLTLTRVFEELRGHGHPLSFIALKKLGIRYFSS